MTLRSKILAIDINNKFWKEEKTLATAESCTGGLIASAITSYPGSSGFYKGGVVAYSVEAKENILGVSKEVIETKGVVSEETVIAMAKGAMKAFDSTCAIATTGIAGPTGGTPENPVGTIWIAAVCGEKVLTEKLESDYGREENVQLATEKALQLTLDLFVKEEK